MTAGLAKCCVIYKCGYVPIWKLTVVTWFCLEFFDFLLRVSFPTSLSSRAAAFLYAPVYGCVRLCSCAKGGGGGVIAERGRTCEEAGRSFCWGGGARGGGGVKSLSRARRPSSLSSKVALPLRARVAHPLSRF